MERFIPFAVIFGTYAYLVWQISVRLGYALDAMSLGAAFAVAALTGITWFTVSDWWSATTRPFHPQTVKTDTKETPNQIGCAAFWAFVKLVLFIIAAAVLIFAAVRSS